MIIFCSTKREKPTIKADNRHSIHIAKVRANERAERMNRRTMPYHELLSEPDARMKIYQIKVSCTYATDLHHKANEYILTARGIGEIARIAHA